MITQRQRTICAIMQMQFSISPSSGNQCAYTVLALPKRALRNKKIIRIHVTQHIRIHCTVTVDCMVLGRCVFRHSRQIRRYRNTFLLFSADEKLIERKPECTCRNMFAIQIINLQKIGCGMRIRVVIER